MVGGDFDQNQSFGNQDIFLIKYNSNGEKQWSKQFGTVEDDFSMDVALNKFNGIFITGTTKGALDGKSYAGGEDVFLIKSNFEGKRQ